jgi:hypothetical protein
LIIVIGLLLYIFARRGAKSHICGVVLAAVISIRARNGTIEYQYPMMIDPTIEMSVLRLMRFSASPKNYLLWNATGQFSH